MSARGGLHCNGELSFKEEKGREAFIDPLAAENASARKSRDSGPLCEGRNY